jgi:ligand-binding SRPBCC domain-containing protein
MKQLKTEVFIPASLEACWQFFSNPANLGKITPPSMDFRIRTEIPDKMYPGLMIGYTVKPFGFGKVGWVTEITQVRFPEYFIDEQRVGPYRLWHHEHFLEEVEGGVIMKDIVSYEPPFGFLGRWIEPWLIRPKLRKIFKFREQKIKEIFAN